MRSLLSMVSPLKISRIFCFIFIFTFLSCSGMSSKERDKQADYYYSMGVSRFAEKNYPEAISNMEKVIEIKPNYFEGHNYLGLIYLELRYYDKAVIEFSRVIEINKDSIDGRNNLGVSYLRMNQAEKAIEMFKTIVENPLYASSERSLSSYRNLGDLYYRKGKYSEAISVLKKAILVSQDYYPAYYLMALSLNKSEKYGYAADALISAIEKDPEYKGDMEKARKDLTKKAFLFDGAEKQDIEDLLEIMNY